MKDGQWLPVLYSQFSWTALQSLSSLLPIPTQPLPTSGLCHLWCTLNIGKDELFSLSIFGHYLAQESTAVPYYDYLIQASTHPHPHPHAISVATHCVFSYLQAFTQAVPAWNTLCRLSPIPSSLANSWSSSLCIISFGKSRDIGAPHVYSHIIPWLLYQKQFNLVFLGLLINLYLPLN